MAAITGLLLATLAPGDTVLLPSDGYFKVREFAATVLAGRGVAVHPVPTAGPYRLAELAPTLVLLETPANPGLAVCDIAAVAAMSRELGAVLAVDNTTATPLGQRPLALGADVVVASGTKALTGHSDLVLGYVATADPGLADRLRGWRAMTGAICGPFEAWLAHRSLATLELRLARQEANAAAVVEFLAGRPEVTGLRWPGLDPLARRQLTRMPGLVTFELADEAAATAFLRATRLVANATSFGGLHSSADRRAQFGDPVPAGLIRLSVGCEDPVDLIDDLRAGLAAG
jgi:cystathionine gamma-lyase